MTKEEIIQAISDDKMMPFIQPEQLARIIDFVSENYKPSLPDGLEEAAEIYYEQDCPYPGEARVVNNEHDVWFPSQAIEDAFIAGAEWGARHSINWGDVQLLDTFILELSREEKDGADWGDSEKFYTEVLRRFHEFNDKKIPEIVAEWGAEHLKRQNMTREEKQLLLKDLCARLPYGVICQLSNKDADVSIIEKLKLGGLEHFIAGSMCVKPYIRPMSSMTEEEYEESCCVNEWTHLEDGTEVPCMAYIDWLNAHHFDYRGLIEKGLALEAPKDMYKTE